MPKRSRSSPFSHGSTSTLIDKTLCEHISRQIEDFEQRPTDLSFDMENSATELILAASPSVVHSMEQNLQGILDYMRDAKAIRQSDQPNLENYSNQSRATSSERVLSTSPITPLTDRSSPDWMWEARLERFFQYQNATEAPTDAAKCIKSQGIQTSPSLVERAAQTCLLKTVSQQTVIPMIRNAAVQTDSEEDALWHAQMKRERKLELKRQQNVQRALEHAQGTADLKQAVRVGIKLFNGAILAEQQRRIKTLAVQRKHLQQLKRRYRALRSRVPMMRDKSTQSEQPPTVTFVNVGTQWHKVRAPAKGPETNIVRKPGQPPKTPDATDEVVPATEEVVPATALQVITHTPPRSFPVVVRDVDCNMTSPMSCVTCNGYGDGSEKLERVVKRQLTPNLQLQYAGPEVLGTVSDAVPQSARRLQMDGDAIITSTGKEAPDGPRFHRDSSTSLSPIVYRDDSD